MTKVSIHSAKIALAISPQIEKGKAKQLLKTGDRGNREDGVTRRSIDLSNYWKKDHVCGTYFVRSIMSGKKRERAYEEIENELEIDLNDIKTKIVGLRRELSHQDQQQKVRTGFE